MIIGQYLIDQMTKGYSVAMIAMAVGNAVYH